MEKNLSYNNEFNLWADACQYPDHFEEEGGIEYCVEYRFCVSESAGAGSSSGILFFPPPDSKQTEQSFPDACHHG